MERQKGPSGRGGEGEERVQGSAVVGELKWKLNTSITVSVTQLGHRPRELETGQVSHVAPERVIDSFGHACKLQYTATIM